MARRPALLARLRRRAIYSRTPMMRAYWRRSLARNRRKYLSATIAFDGTPVMRGLALLLGEARRRGWTGGLNSADRREGVAERFGRSSQAALYRGWLRRLPGFNPANPPGRSSHELRSDGHPVFGRLAGAVLPWYMLGLDVGAPASLTHELAKLGVKARQPYSSPSEAHHVNVLADPTDVLVELGYV